MATSAFLPVRWIYKGELGGGDWPSFSTDGSQVVFTIGGADQFEYALWTMNSEDGSGLTKIYPAAGETGNGSRPDWSWNADAIAFAQFTSETSLQAAQIWTVAPDGSGAALYNPSVSADVGLIYPSWAQDCQSLVAVGYTGGTAATQASLYQLTPASITQITTSPNPVAGRPSISPDGSSVAFAGNQGSYNQIVNQIWVVDPASGLPPQRIEAGTDLAAIQGRSPNWGPMGNLIVFESTRPAPNPTSKSPLAIWVMSSDGTNPRPLTDITKYSAYHGEWSRDQQSIVFASNGRIGIIEPFYVE